MNDTTPDNSFDKSVALIVVDVQKAFDNPQWGQRNNPGAEANIQRLLLEWRNTNRPIFHIQHRSARAGQLFSPDQPGYDIKPEASPLSGEPVIVKRVNSAFIGTDLEDRLRHDGISTVVICGITTDHCVSTTTRMASNLGFQATVVSDATATFERVGHDGRHWTAEEMHESALTSLHAEFATVRTANEVFHWLDSRAVLGDPAAGQYWS